MVEIVVTGRHTEVPARLRSYAEEKLAKVEKLCPKAIRIDVEVSRERNPRMSEICDRVELTCVSRGPVIRAEAAAEGVFAAFDLAWAKLETRLRKAADRRRVHRGSRTPLSVAVATTGTPGPELAGALGVNNHVAAASGASIGGTVDDTSAPGISDEEPVVAGSARYVAEGPMLVREKSHVASPMTLDQALYEMELVGHDFYLFCDKESGLPSVVYRRRGYDYGVIRLNTEASEQGGMGTDTAAVHFEPGQLDGSQRSMPGALAGSSARAPQLGEIGR